MVVGSNPCLIGLRVLIIPTVCAWFEQTKKSGKHIYTSTRNARLWANPLPFCIPPNALVNKNPIKPPDWNITLLLEHYFHNQMKASWNGYICTSEIALWDIWYVCAGWLYGDMEYWDGGQGQILLWKVDVHGLNWYLQLNILWFRFILESHMVECTMGSPVDWREIFMKQSVGKCK